MRAAFLQAVDNCNHKLSWWLTTYILKWTLLILAFAAWSLVMYRAGGVRADQKYEEWKERFADNYISQMEAAERGLPPDPFELQKEHEISMIAKALYGVKGNSDADLHKYCWCFFNRVDTKSGEFSTTNTLDDVFSKAGQFMGYSENNPVLDRLKAIASEEYSVWKDSKSRPYDVDYVFAYWTPDKIMLLKSMNDLVHGV